MSARGGSAFAGWMDSGIKLMGQKPNVTMFYEEETQESQILTWLDLILRKATGIWLTLMKSRRSRDCSKGSRCNGQNSILYKTRT